MDLHSYMKAAYHLRCGVYSASYDRVFYELTVKKLLRLNDTSFLRKHLTKISFRLQDQKCEPVERSFYKTLYFNKKGLKFLSNIFAIN